MILIIAKELCCINGEKQVYNIIENKWIQKNLLSVEVLQITILEN
jgi:uncharacterized Fe-S cluster protein YjdI